MSTPFQNRLVGTVIVAALAIIFLPDILDGDKQSYQEEFASIPQAPSVDIKTEKKSFPTDKLAQIPQDELSDETALDDNEDIAQLDSSVVDKGGSDTVKVATLEKETNFSSANAATAEQTIENNSRKLPEKSAPREAWEIQLGSFRHKKNVDELVTKLRNNGYTVFTKPINTKSGQLTKVIVGPEFSKVTLEKQLPELKKLTGVQGKISKFTPTK
ncbi:SPOR domain-containing protein [Thalassotalea fusca]